MTNRVKSQFLAICAALLVGVSVGVWKGWDPGFSTAIACLFLVQLVHFATEKD